MVMLADVCVYRAEGFFGFAVFFVTGRVLLAFGIPQRSQNVICPVPPAVQFTSPQDKRFRAYTMQWF